MATKREKKVQLIYNKLFNAGTGIGTDEDKIINALDELSDREETLRLFTIFREQGNWKSFTNYINDNFVDGIFGGDDKAIISKIRVILFQKAQIDINFYLTKPDILTGKTYLTKSPKTGNIIDFPNGEDLKPDIGPLGDIGTASEANAETAPVDTTTDTSIAEGSATDAATTVDGETTSPANIAPPPGFSPTLINNMIRDLINYYEGPLGESTTFSGVIPVVINLELEGIAGIKIGNIFNIKGGEGVYKNILPEAYRNSKLNFLVKTLSHSVQNNYWITKIEGYPFIANFINNTKLNKNKLAISAANNKQSWSLLINASGGTLFIDTAKFANTKTADDVFYKQIVEGVGAQWNNKTKLMMYAWRQTEGGEAANNPFNTTLAMGEENEGCIYNCLKGGAGTKPTGCKTCPPGYTLGVRNYKTPAVGVRATLQTLKATQKYPGYQKIIDAMKNNDLYGFAKAVGDSDWGSSKLILQILKGYENGASPKPPPIYSYKA
jgi:hypothetical protein